MSTASEVPQIGRNWWLFLILGLVSILAGILAIVYPDITLLALGLFIGVSLMFVGAMDIVEAIAGDPESRALSAITGVLALLAGLVCLRRPGESLLALVIVLGFYLVITGVIRFVRSFAQLEDRALLHGARDPRHHHRHRDPLAAEAGPRHARRAVRDLAAGARRVLRGHRLQAAGRTQHRRAGRRRNRLMQNPPDGMAWVPAGEFAMGSEAFYPEEGPVRPVAVEGFWIDRDPVTVADFRRFVKATGHVTVAERPLDPDDYPDADPELLVPGALVFQPSRGPVDLRDFRNWWDYVPGTTWQRPEGPASDTYTRGRHPVTQVAYEDASAYAAWAGKALPTEAEWEFAARGGLDGAVFAWGDEFAPGWPDDGQHLAGRVPVAEPARRRLRGHLTGRLVRRPTASACTT